METNLTQEKPPEVHCSHTEMRDPSDVTPHPKNPNTHPDEQLELLGKIIQSTGWRNPIVVSKRSGFIIKGHARLEVAKRNGWQAPIDLQDYESEEQELADLIADNRIAELAELDLGALQDIVNGMEEVDLELLGFTQESWDGITGEEIDPEEVIDDTETAEDAVTKAEELAAEWGTKAGQTWEIGKHRLHIGDSTKRESYLQLLGDKYGQVDMVWTDPPYGVNYESKAGKVHNDHLKDNALQQFLLEFFQNCHDASKEGSPIYVAHAESTSLEFRSALQQAGYPLKQFLVWVKSKFHLGRQDYQWMHEPILYSWKQGAAHFWRGGFDKSTVIEEGADLSKLKKPDLIEAINNLRNALNTSVIRIKKPNKSELHPTMKPPELVAKMIYNSSPVGGLLLDPFLGSGTTMVAGAQMGRICYGLELSPDYAAVILERMRLTLGIEGKLVRDE